MRRTAAFLVLALGVAACGEANEAAVEARDGGVSLTASASASTSAPTAVATIQPPPTTAPVATSTSAPQDRPPTTVPLAASTSAPQDSPPTTQPVGPPPTTASVDTSTSAVDTLSTDEVAFMLAGAFGEFLQRNDLAGVGPALDAVLARSLPRNVTISHPFDGPQPLDEFLETMRRRVDEGHLGLSPAVTVRGEILLMSDAGLLPGLPAMVADGVHTVDVDMPPGWYVAWDVAECSWARLDSDGDVIDWNFVRRSPRAEVHIRPSDHGFRSEHCGRWIKLD